MRYGTCVAVLGRVEKTEFMSPMFIGEVAHVCSEITYTSHHSVEVQVHVMAENVLTEVTAYAEDKRLPLMQIRDILKQMATALENLGHLKIIHAALMLENIMMSRQGQFKLMDFCSAMYESQAKTGVMHQSIWYRSPEMMLGLPFTRAIDMWSLGCIAAELLTGCPMYPGNNDQEMVRVKKLTNKAVLWYVPCSLKNVDKILDVPPIKV
ncbi:hypothetical protein CRUP_032406 [Coryphaenoides rupestris]|nr:hypothetical protein CRUP_032406 [Coryphaenoides rupestris]